MPPLPDRSASVSSLGTRGSSLARPFQHRILTARIILNCVLLGLLPAPAAFACGPDFPNAYLAEGSVSLLSAPEGYFVEEIGKIAALKSSHNYRDEANHQAIEAANKIKAKGELTETGVLRLELQKRGMSQELIDTLAAELEATRAAIFKKNWSDAPSFSDGMPTEFSLYLTGAFYYWKGEHGQARDYWKKLLALPESDRRHYSVNTAYMIGRLYIPDATDEGLPVRRDSVDNSTREMLDGVKWLVKAREYAAAGFSDLSGLAQASLGWEARAWFLNGDDAKAIHLYLEQYRHGYEKNASLSLRAVARAALGPFEWSENPGDKSAVDNLKQLAQDELSRRVLTVYLLARFGHTWWEQAESEKRISRQSRQWADILTQAQLCKVPDTDKFAWLAYQAAYFELAEQWVKLAPEDSVPGNWIRAKLALRAGNSGQGKALLEKVKAHTEKRSEAWATICQELGRVCMGRGEYLAALDTLLTGSHWEDSAYIAERVLTLEELIGYVNEHCRGESSAGDEDWVHDEKMAREALRHLLARRLARAHQVEEAMVYFPADVRKLYSDYIDDVRLGFDVSLSPEKRSAAFWRAAINARTNGMEMLGTELAPDYFIWGGSFEWSEIAEKRRGSLRL